MQRSSNFDPLRWPIALRDGSLQRPAISSRTSTCRNSQLEIHPSNSTAEARWALTLKSPSAESLKALAQQLVLRQRPLQSPTNCSVCLHENQHHQAREIANPSFVDQPKQAASHLNSPALHDRSKQDLQRRPQASPSLHVEAKGVSSPVQLLVIHRRKSTQERRFALNALSLLLHSQSTILTTPHFQFSELSRIARRRTMSYDNQFWPATVPSASNNTLHLANQGPAPE